MEDARRGDAWSRLRGEDIMRGRRTVVARLYES